MVLKFNQVDVFTSVPFKGNPVAVVFEADKLTTSQMQQIANWTNLSETTFIQSSKVGDYKLRIFSPRSELKFAGHPTIGSATALIKSGALGPGKSKYIQECVAGLVVIKFENDIVYAKVPPIKIMNIEINNYELEEAIGCKLNCEPIALDAGPIWLTASVEELDSLNNIHPDFTKIQVLSKSVGISGINLYCMDKEKNVHLRTFAPLLGVPEDPVCGSGNAAVACHMKLIGKANLVGNRYSASQGSMMGRNGIIELIYDHDDIYIGGKSVIVIDGTIAV